MIVQEEFQDLEKLMITIAKSAGKDLEKSPRSKIFQDALYWVKFDDLDNQFSFVNICLQLGADVDNMREQIYKRLEERGYEI